MKTIHLIVDARRQPLGRAYTDSDAAQAECARRNQAIRDRYPDSKGNAWHVEALEVQS